MHFYLEDELNQINRNDKDLNPTINLEFIVAEEPYPFTKNLKLFDNENERFFDKYLEKNITSFNVSVLYECEDNNCTISNIYAERLTFTVSMILTIFTINHQKEESPFENLLSVYVNRFYFYNKTDVTWDWYNIIYKEKKGFFKQEETLYRGYPNDIFKTFSKTNIFNINGTYYKELLDFRIDNAHHIEEIYERKAKDIFDYIAIVLSYFSNGYFILKNIFLFYSKNFNNYKIIEKILSKGNNLIDYKIPLEDYIIPINSNSRSESENDIGYKDGEDLLDNKTEKEDELINTYKGTEDIGNGISFKKIRFIHFFLNNLYCKCCSKINTQEILNISNKILYKYISVDSIAYNQILLENLFKDYKWNNPNLRNIYNNNELIIQLRNHTWPEIVIIYLKYS